MKIDNPNNIELWDYVNYYNYDQDFSEWNNKKGLVVVIFSAITIELDNTLGKLEQVMLTPQYLKKLDF